MVVERTTIIGISPGSRYLGVAILKGSKLIDWRIKVIRAKTLIERINILERIILKLNRIYRPNYIALKGVHSSRSSRQLDGLLIAIREFSERLEIDIHEYSLEKIKAILLDGKKGNKRMLGEHLASMYPVLYRELREKKNTDKYRIKIFEAVAVATVHSRITQSCPRIGRGCGH